MTLTLEGCRRRQQLLLEKVQDVDYVVITDPRNIFYFTGHYASQLNLGGWGHNYLILDTHNGESLLLTHNFFAPAPDAVAVDKLEVWTWYDAVHNSGNAIFPEGLRELNARLGAFQGKKAGIEAGWFPHGARVGETVDITYRILDLRRQKHPDELAMIREAIRTVEAGHRAARQVIRPGVTEIDVFNAVCAAMVMEVGHPILPIGDFVSGERTYTVGGPPTSRKLAAGELMIVDITPVVNGYRADFTATIAVDGQLTPKQKALETALLEAIAAGESKLKAGVRCADVYQAVRAGLGDFAEGLVHHAGHGLGLGHPEAPYFVTHSDEILRAGDVVTLEPGSYGAGFGGRVERNYLITEQGFENLTHHSLTFT
jgi:Xaa-Pro aminopeptidase